MGHEVQYLKVSLLKQTVEVSINGTSSSYEVLPVTLETILVSFISQEILKPSKNTKVFA